MSTSSEKVTQRTRRHARIRSRVSGTATCPRLAVFRSNRFIYAQLIDDESQKTIAAADSRRSKHTASADQAKEVGTAIAAVAKTQKIEHIVFDRGGFRYQGAIAALADGAREGGLLF